MSKAVLSPGKFMEGLHRVFTKFSVGLTRHYETRIYYCKVKSQSNPSLVTRPELSRDIARVRLGVELSYKILLNYGIL